MKKASLIMAVKIDNTTYMCGDSVCVSYSDEALNSIYTTKDPKIAKYDSKIATNPILIGGAGNWSEVQPVIKSIETLAMSETIEDVIKKIKKIMKKEHVLTTSETGVQSCESDFLIIHKGTIYAIGDDFSIVQPDTPFFAIGAAFEGAMACLHLLISPEKPEDSLVATSPENVLKQIGEAVERSNPYIKGPFHVISKEW